MKLTNRLAFIVTACGIAMTATAQDSVSPTGALPGDALDAYSTTEVRNAYVVDMADLTGSWGTTLRVGPVLKGVTLPSNTFYNNLISAHAISHDAITAGSYPSANYQVWSGPGFGINDTNNTVPGTTSPTGSSVQFGVAFADFGTTFSGASYNGTHQRG